MKFLPDRKKKKKGPWSSGKVGKLQEEADR
jgi:hypothetical protein